MSIEHLNRRGRPKGAKNKISESFVEAMSDDFGELEI